MVTFSNAIFPRIKFESNVIKEMKLISIFYLSLSIYNLIRVILNFKIFICFDKITIRIKCIFNLENYLNINKMCNIKCQRCFAMLYLNIQGALS